MSYYTDQENYMQEGIMNGKMPPNNTWQFTSGFRTDQAAFTYEEHCRNALPQPRNFEMDMNAMRTAPSFIPPFIPRFGTHSSHYVSLSHQSLLSTGSGLQMPDFDYRLNEFPRTGLFGACSFAAPIATHQLAHSFGIGSAIPASSAASAMDSLQLPTPQQQLVPNHVSVIHRAPNFGVDTPDKPPVLSVETYPEKIEISGFDSKPDFPDDKALNASGAADKVEKTEKRHAIIFDRSFYPNPAPIDMTSGGFMKQELHSPSVHDNPTDYSRVQDGISVKKEFADLHDCQVCLSTHANGLHFGARTCAACAAFFRRTISDHKRYVCKRNQRCQNASRDGTGYRKICRCCRMKRCIEIGMLPENVQHKRSRRESTPTRKLTGFDSFFPTFYQPHPPHTNQ